MTVGKTMRQTFFILLAGLILLTGCATKTVTPNVIQLDMSATRMVAGNSKLMTAEVIYIKNLANNDEEYRFEVSNRRQLGIDNYVQVLKPSYYEIATVCAEKSFLHRMAGLVGIEKRDNGQLWARFQTALGTSALIPAYVMNLELMGTESIVPLNMSYVGNQQCEALYGEGDLNTTPENTASNQEYLAKYVKRTTLYSYW